LFGIKGTKIERAKRIGRQSEVFMSGRENWETCKEWHIWKDGKLHKTLKNGPRLTH